MRTLAALLVAVVAVPTAVWPSAAVADGAAGSSRVVTSHKKAPPAPSAPPAVMALHVTPAALGTPWTLEVTNNDTIPLRFVTDPGLVTLDVTPISVGPGKRQTVHCALPSDVRPATDDERARVLLPGVTYVETFDPREYCFSGHEAEALSPGAELVARLGWAEAAIASSGGAKAHAPPFVADQIDGGEARSGVKELRAEAVTVPERLDLNQNVNQSGLAPPSGAGGAITVSLPARADAELGRRFILDVAVDNPTSRTVRLMLRPETLTFEVASLRGVRQCGSKRGPGAPIAEVFTAIPPHGRVSTEVLLTALCPEDTLDAAGLYTVRAGLDTRRASGKSIGLTTFDGVAVGKDVMLVRVRRDHHRAL